MQKEMKIGLILFIEDALKKEAELVSCAVNASLANSASFVSFVQVYSSKSTENCNALYRFPLPENAAVTSFSAQINNDIFIKSVVKQKNVAKAEFDDALKQGKQAILLDQNYADGIFIFNLVFQISIGNIPPLAKVVVHLNYIAELKRDAEQNSYRFSLPTAIAPRYGTPNFSEQSISSTNVPLSIKVDIKSSDKIVSIQSPSHPISVTLDSKESEIFNSLVEFASNETLKDDLVVIVKTLSSDVPTAIYETNEKGSTIQLTMVPKFAQTQITTEIILLLDLSGSMEGSKIQQLKKAVLLLIKSFPETCFFNIICFGSSFKSMFSKSLQYSRENFEIGLKYVEGLQADMGGTEIFNAMKHAISNRRLDMPSQLFLITDGECWNEKEIFQLVSDNVKPKDANFFRVFTLGIGNQVSHALVEGIASAGRGYSEFVAENERLEKKVIGQLKNALLPPLECNIDWGVVDSDFDLVDDTLPVEPIPGSLFNEDVAETSIPQVHKYKRVEEIQAPYYPPPLFAGSRFTIYFISKSSKTPSSISISATSNNGPLTLSIPLKRVENCKLNVLAARKIIQDLDTGKSYLDSIFKNSKPPSSVVDSEITRFGIQYGLISSQTSFVGVYDSGELVGDLKAAEPEEYEYGGYEGFDPPPDTFSLPPKKSKAKRSLIPSAVSSFATRLTSSFGSSVSAPFPAPPTYTPTSSSYSPTAPIYATSSPSFDAIKSPIYVPTPLNYSSTAAPIRATTSTIDIPVTAAHGGGAANKVQEKPKTKIELLDAIIELQAFDGSFEMSSAVLEACKTSVEEMRQGYPGISDERVVFTLFLIDYLKREMIEFEDEIGFIIKKAVSFVELIQAKC